MNRVWLLFAAFALALATVAVRAEDYYDYGDENLEDGTWYVDDAPEVANLDVMLDNLEELTNSNTSDKEIEKKNEEDAKDKTAEMIEELVDVMDSLDENSDEVVVSAKDEHIDNLDQKDWAQSSREQPLENEVDENFDDYQVEDNRSDTKEEEPLENQPNFPDNEDNPSDDVNDQVNYPEFAEDDKNEEPADIDQIIAETKKLLEEGNSEFEEDIEDKNLASAETKDSEINESALDNSNDDSHQEESFDDIIQNQIDDEIQKFINEMDNDQSQSNENESGTSDNEDADRYTFKEDVDDPIDHDENEEELETDVLKYVNDMIDPEETEMVNVDSNDASNANYNIQNTDASKHENNDNNDSDDYDTVDKVYKDLDTDLEKLFKTWNKLVSDESETEEDNDMGIEEYEEKFGKPFREGIVLQQRDELYADVNDDDIVEKSDTRSEDDTDKNDTHDFSEKELPVAEIPEGDVSNTEEDNDEEDEPYIDETKKIIQGPMKTMNVDELNKEQYTELMKRFEIEHKSDIDSLEKGVAPIYMSIKSDEIIEITSPNYPGVYPTNNVVDWIIEGDGEGIELNITELELRGLQGDYLLIRPGAFNDDSHGGLLFSYHLNDPSLRHFRFTDASRLFVRFNTGTGLNFLTGFRMTVKMIWPPTSLEEEDLPEQEALRPYLPATMTVNLGGIKYPEFKNMSENFRRLVADMATMYINANFIDPGKNTTLETAQISNTASCNINWPNFMECVQVTFGVPLVYNEEISRLNQDDLVDMWMTYVNQDPFAARLRAMGITEFDIQSNRSVMLAWVVLGCGAMIAAAMLSFSMWRYSCFQDYVRMKDYGDRDSLREEKRRHDLYPTPHQPLPALYADNDYKWADAKYDDTTRVDLGGFANSGYTRDELLDIDTDEEAVAVRDRYTTDV